MKNLTKILKVLFTITVLVVIPIVVFTFITAKTSLLGIKSFVVLSGSMQPTLSVGSVIYTQMQNSYKKGDIIAFKQGDVNVTHRIASVNSDGTFTTKGDANNTKDSTTVSQNDVFGKNVFFLPYLGRAIVFLKTPLGFFSTIFFPIAVFIVLELWNLKKEIERAVRKKVQQEINVQHPLRNYNSHE